MLGSSAQRVERLLPDEARVLDVGGWAAPLARADWVIDLFPHATRGLYGHEGGAGPARERFTAETWVQRNICDRAPWPFEDEQFDFAVCAHTLEDVRDPVWVCQELQRVARAGYIEVPSRLEEQTYGIQGPWVGWSHHHWLCDVGEREIQFVFKSHVIHSRAGDHLPAGFAATLTPEQRVQQLWWEGGFAAREHVFVEAAGLDAYLSDFVAAHRPAEARTTRAWLGRRRRRRR